jgi:hypothetical protein
MTKKCYHANLRGGVLEDFFKIFFKGKSLSVFGSGGLKGGEHYKISDFLVERQFPKELLTPYFFF